MRRKSRTQESWASVWASRSFALLINRSDPVPQGLGLILLAGLHQGPHLFGQGVALVAQLFQAGQELAALGLPPPVLIQGELLAPVFQGLFHFLLMFSHKLQIQHGQLPVSIKLTAKDR